MRSNDGFLAYHSLLNWFNRGTQTQTGTTKEKPCAREPKPREFNHEPYYTGPLIDDHVHMPVSSGIVSTVGKSLGFKDMPVFGSTLPGSQESLTPEYLTCLFKSEGISKAIGFFLTTKYSLGAEVRSAQKFGNISSAKIVPFLMPAPYNALRITPQTVRETLDKNKGLFKGIGEIKSFDGSPLDNPYFSEMFKIANDYNLLVLMHPYRDHKPVVEKISSA